MEELINVLAQEKEVYKKLLALSLQKTPVIVSADLEALASITDEEQAIVSDLSRLDKKRELCMTDIANVINKDVKTLKLGDLVDMLASRPAEQKKLAEITDDLSQVITQMKRSNEQNKSLIESSLEMVQFDMNVLNAVKAAPETANYTRNAYNAGDVMGVQHRGFDSKS